MASTGKNRRDRTHRRSPRGRGALAALTFDFWNTLYADDHTSWGRVKPRRIEVLRGLLGTAGLDPTEEAMEGVYTSAFDVYMAAWTGGRHFGAREEALFFLERFGIDQDAVARPVLEQAVRDIEEAARLGSLPLVPGAAETIPRLAEAGYRLGIISDTSLTPGRILSEFLEADGLLQYFSAFTFSDVTGYPKPDSRMFTATLAVLDAEPGSAAHVGDMPRTDIFGAKSVGMTAIRCASINDHPEEPAADFVIRDHRELPAILQALG